VMTPLERKAAFKAAVTMRQCTAAVAARQLKVSYNHLMLVLNGGAPALSGCAVTSPRSSAVTRPKYSAVVPSAWRPSLGAV
jgi:hypothetical protein